MKPTRSRSELPSRHRQGCHTLTSHTHTHTFIASYLCLRCDMLGNRSATVTHPPVRLPGHCFSILRENILGSTVVFKTNISQGSLSKVEVACFLYAEIYTSNGADNLRPDAVRSLTHGHMIRFMSAPYSQLSRDGVARSLREIHSLIIFFLNCGTLNISCLYRDLHSNPPDFITSKLNESIPLN